MISKDTSNVSPESFFCSYDLSPNHSQKRHSWWWFFLIFFFLTHKARINTTGQCSQTLLLFLGRTGKKLALVSRWLRKILIMKDLQHLLTALGSNAETNPKLNFGQENLAVHLGHDCQLESLAYSKAVLRLSSQSAINGTQERWWFSKLNWWLLFKDYTQEVLDNTSSTLCKQNL